MPCSHSMQLSLHGVGLSELGLDFLLPFRSTQLMPNQLRSRPSGSLSSSPSHRNAAKAQPLYMPKRALFQNLDSSFCAAQPVGSLALFARPLPPNQAHSTPVDSHGCTTETWGPASAPFPSASCGRVRRFPGLSSCAAAEHKKGGQREREVSK